MNETLDGAIECMHCSPRVPELIPCQLQLDMHHTTWERDFHVTTKNYCLQNVIVGLIDQRLTQYKAVPYMCTM